MGNEFDEIREMCKPIVKYLKENHNPHCEVVVNIDKVTVKEGIVGVVNM